MHAYCKCFDVRVFLRGGAWHSYSCGQTVRRIKIPLGKEVGLGPGHIVLDGDPAPTAAPPHFRPNCGALVKHAQGAVFCGLSVL